MKKRILNEEVAKMRKMMGLTENYDIDSHYEDSVMGDVPGETVEPEEDYDDLIEFDIPDWAVSALINGDYSGLSDEEESELNAFVDRVVEKYGNAHFMVDDYEKSHLGFLTRNDINSLGGDCTLLKIRPSSMDEGDNPVGTGYMQDFKKAKDKLKGGVAKLGQGILDILAKGGIDENAPEDYMPYREDQSDIDDKIKMYMSHHDITDLTQGIKDYMALCLWKGDEATMDDNQEGEAVWQQRYNAAKKKLMGAMDESGFQGEPNFQLPAEGGDGVYEEMMKEGYYDDIQGYVSTSQNQSGYKVGETVKNSNGQTGTVYDVLVAPNKKDFLVVVKFDTGNGMKSIGKYGVGFSDINDIKKV